MDVSFAILAHNEGKDLENLLNQIISSELDYECEVVIVDDYSTDEYTRQIIDEFGKLDNIHVFQRELNKDFASQKNYANSKCEGKYIFSVDADEYFPTDLIENIYILMELNPKVDLIRIPRINLVGGLTKEHIKKWNWHVNSMGWINFPDFQSRLYKNSADIKWKNKVHEIVDGAKVISTLPTEQEWCLVHNKHINKQEQQNEFYEGID
jgi:glycosyltransferase involved in cell wall biosynthesis